MGCVDERETFVGNLFAAAGAVHKRVISRYPSAWSSKSYSTARDLRRRLISVMIAGAYLDRTLIVYDSPLSAVSILMSRASLVVMMRSFTNVACCGVVSYRLMA